MLYNLCGKHILDIVKGRRRKCIPVTQTYSSNNGSLHWSCLVAGLTGQNKHETLSRQIELQPAEQLTTAINNKVYLKNTMHPKSYYILTVYYTPNISISISGLLLYYSGLGHDCLVGEIGSRNRLRYFSFKHEQQIIQRAAVKEGPA